MNHPKNSDWPFDDPPNVAVFTSKRIVEGTDWIYYVGHDADDGAWQFHGPSGPCDVDSAVLVSLKSVVQRDQSVRSLADLPVGWCAWREKPNGEWKRAPKG